MLEAKSLPIIEDPLHLTLYQKDSVNLTLIDLPGITYEKELIVRIKNLIKSHICNKNTVNLIVVSSTQDLNTTQAIEFARDEDPNNERSLMVVTKIDRMEKGFTCQFANQYGLGIVAVRNRTQEEVDEEISFEEVREKERQAIQSSEELQELPDYSKGTESLI